METYLLFHYPTIDVRFDVVRRYEVKESERKNESESEKNPPLYTFGRSITKEVVYILSIWTCLRVDIARGSASKCR